MGPGGQDSGGASLWCRGGGGAPPLSHRSSRHNRLPASAPASVLPCPAPPPVSLPPPLPCASTPVLCLHPCPVLVLSCPWLQRRHHHHGCADWRADEAGRPIHRRRPAPTHHRRGGCLFVRHVWLCAVCMIAGGWLATGGQQARRTGWPGNRQSVSSNVPLLPPVCWPTPPRTPSPTCPPACLPAGL